jgi:putative oxidoreductase
MSTPSVIGARRRRPTVPPRLAAASALSSRPASTLAQYLRIRRAWRFTMPLNPGIAEQRLLDRDIDDAHDELVHDAAAHSAWQTTMALFGRLLIAAIFLTSGIAKLTDLPGTVAKMTSKGIPYADTLAMVAGVSEVLGAVALVFGLLTRVGAVGLILFMIPTTLIFHAFWNFHGAERMPQMVNFMKNLAIIGGLATLAAFGAGRASLDYRLRRRRP